MRDYYAHIATTIEIFRRCSEIKRTIITILSLILCVLIAGCVVGCSAKKQEFILNGLDINKIPDCYEANKNIFGEQTGTAFKSGDLLFYGQYTYRNMHYDMKKSDGLYVTYLKGGQKYKLADGIICSVVVREDGVYYLKYKAKGEKNEIWLYNFDLYRYSFESGKNELLISDCSYVQFSEDAVFYCPQYLSEKDFYIEEGRPLDLENESKIVRHSLVDGEETVVAEVEGGIYNFLVGEGIIAFSGGDGDHYVGGQNLYICRLDGSGLQKLTENDNGHIKILSVEDNQIIYSSASPDGSNFCRMNMDSKEVQWSYSWDELYSMGACDPVVVDGKIYFRREDPRNYYREIICVETNEPMGEVSFITLKDYCLKLYVFDGRLYATLPRASDSTDMSNVLTEINFSISV